MSLTKVHLRPAVSQDLPRIAEVAAQSMLDDELFAFLCPRRREFYSDYRQSFLRRLRGKLTSPGFPELWFLSTLAVHPAYQRQGIGRKLVEWGLEQATQDEIPVGLEASAKGTHLYHSLGFQIVNEIPLLEEIALTAMVWRPSPQTA
ncbi:hypothetical protein BBP40_006157 [Aspergillus hancockii]|nr:hypothetical protein BBP40_006157 [Aspergillus hancockii]